MKPTHRRTTRHTRPTDPTRANPTSATLTTAAVTVVALLAAAMAACAPSVRYATPETPLERAIVLVETDGRGATHPLSTGDTTTVAARRVPAPAPVDINSRIDILLRPGHLMGRAAPGLDARLEAATTRAESLRRVLEALGGYVEARGRLVALYESMPPRGTMERAEWRDRFAAAKAASASAEVAFLERVLEEWPEDTEVHAMAAAAAGDPAFKRHVEARIAEEEAAYERLLETVRETGYTLRLTAMLMTADGSPTPVHLPGYDSIPEGTLATVDRWGLSMTGAQQARYDQAVDLRNRMLDVAEAVRTGEQTAEAALASLAETRIGGVAGLAAEALELGRRLRPDSLRARLNATEAAFDLFAVELRRDLQDSTLHVVPMASDIQGGLDSVRALLTVDATATLLDATAAGMQGLRASLASAADAFVRGGSLPPLETALATLRDTAQAYATLFPDFETLVPAITEPDDLTALAVDDANRVVELWSDSDALREIQGWAALIASLHDLAERAQAMYDVVTGTPIAGMPVSVPETTFDVPLDEARSTSLDLRRTPRTEGDRIEVRARVLEAGADAYPPYTASLEVERLGFHARLDPGLALVTPHGDRPGGTARFRFAPVLSWIHTYTPRPDEHGLGARLARATGAFWGLHAASLDFDPGNSLEIGLGATAGLWDGVLMGGVGYNLMASGDGDDGGGYWVVGSSLIALLQLLSDD